MLLFIEGRAVTEMLFGVVATNAYAVRGTGFTYRIALAVHLNTVGLLASTASFLFLVLRKAF